MNNNEREQQIIKQLKGYLSNLNSERMRERVEIANEEGTLEAYKKLLVALNNPPLYNRLAECLGDSRANAFVEKFSKILIGEYLENK